MRRTVPNSTEPHGRSLNLWVFSCSNSPTQSEQRVPVMSWSVIKRIILNNLNNGVSFPTALGLEELSKKQFRLPA